MEFSQFLRATGLYLMLLITSDVYAEEEMAQTNETQPAIKQNWYSVVGSSSISPNKDYHCAVTSSIAATIDVGITGKQNSGEKLEISQTVTLKPYITETVTFQIGSIGSGEYNLTAKSDGDMKFSNSSKLTYEEKSVTIFIQTDRAVYKPGAKVQFRVIVLNSKLKPIVTNDLHVYITDGNDNRLKEWKNVSTTKGVWSGEMDLSDSPVLGDWTIHASALKRKEMKNFEVAEYVLPRFEVSVNVPQHILFNDSRVAAEIDVKYTHGRPVKGKATITMQMDDFPAKKEVKKQVDIDGKAIVDFDIVKEFNLTEEKDNTGNRFQWRPYHFEYERNIKFEASVTEDLTGKVQNGSADTTLHKKKYKLDLVKTSEYFKPSLIHTVFVKVTKFDGTPVTSSDKPLQIKHGFKYGEANIMSSHDITPSGLVKLTFTPPSNASVLIIEGSFEDVNKTFEYINAATSPSQNYIQVTITTEKPKVNSEIEVMAELTEHSPYIVYQIIGRRDILLADSITLEEGSKSAKFKFMTTGSMAPKSKLIVYYIRQDGEIVVDVTEIEMNPILDNFVTVETSSDELAPGEEIQLKLKTKPNSYVGLLGVDQSVLLLKKGNDILMENVIEEMKSYSGNSYRWHWFGGNTAKSMFESSDVVVLTNGEIYEPRYPGGIMYDSMPVALENAGFVNNKVMFGMPGPAMAFASATRYGGSVASFIPKPRLRSSFPETWIWQNISTNDVGQVTLRKKVPDTITSWVISAFSLDSSNGFGLIDMPRKIKVFRPFFISMDLPYSIIRGEEVSIPVGIFNYLDNEITADVTLENHSAQFEFTDYSRNGTNGEKLEPTRTKKITVQPNTGEKVSFSIKATELGFISIKVTATSQLAGDAVERKLLVKAEGETQYKNEAVFVDLRQKDSMNKKVKIELPEEFVAGSVRVEVSAVGDILGTSLQNLEKLIRMPFGCGEQNMLNFVPNIVILDYLKNSGQLTPEVEGKCLKYMDTGYQRELSYKHLDGSFSAFGNHDKSGSTWLTAFVLKSFASAKPYMNIDDKVMKEGLKWLAKQQTENGSFPEVGTVSHKDMQGGSGQGLALTSFSLLPFLAQNDSSYKTTVDKALTYISSQLDNIKNDSYSLAISTYALHLAQHPDKDKAYQMLQDNAESLNQGLMKRWKRAEKLSDNNNPYSINPNSVDVEMTAYAMLVNLDKGMTEQSIPIMTWLLSQQNSDGGFASTQDTVVALTALSKLASKITDKNPDIKTTFTFEDSSVDIQINSDNALVLQKEILPSKVREVDVSAKGKGFGVVQVSYSYNINVDGAFPMFNLTPTVNQASTDNLLILDLCSSFASMMEGNEEESSNMVVMEVTLPSGYTVDQDSVPDLQASGQVKRVELQDGDTHIVLYFDKMTKEEICTTVKAFKIHQVSNQKPVPVTVYDYYDQSRRARAFYSITDSS